MRRRSNKTSCSENNRIDQRVITCLFDLVDIRPNFQPSVSTASPTHGDKWIYVHAALPHERPVIPLYSQAGNNPYIDKLSTDRLEYEGKILKLNNEMLDIYITFDNGLYSFYDRKFGIYGSGETREKAFHDYKGFFFELYEDIMSTPEEELPHSTRKFKNTLECFATLENGS